MHRVYSPSEYRLSGFSVASVETYFYLGAAKLGIDAGWESPSLLLKADSIYLSHLHLDHWAGIPQILFQNHIQKKKIKLLASKEILAGLASFLENLRRVCGSELLYELEEVSAEHPIRIKSWSFYPHEMDHSRPCYGLSANCMGEKRFIYSSDTTWKGIENNPVFFDYPVVLMESTYLAPGDKDKAEKHRHTHLENIKLNFKRFNCEKMFLHHVSPRYSEEEKRKYLNYYFSDEEKKRIEFWNIF